MLADFFLQLGIHDLPLAALGAILIIVTPGPDMLYVMGQSSMRGLRTGLLAAFGTGFGCLLHVTFAALGLTTLLATSAVAFTVVKLVGAAYLAYLGLQLLFSPRRGQSEEPAMRHKSGNSFWQAVLINATNPKVALFFLAFLPQFISASSQHKTLAFFILGVSFGVVGMSWNLLMAWTAARLKDQLARSAQFGNWLNRALGCVFIGFGVRLALSSRS